MIRRSFSRLGRASALCLLVSTVSTGPVVHRWLTSDPPRRATDPTGGPGNGVPPRPKPIDPPPQDPPAPSPSPPKPPTPPNLDRSSPDFGTDPEPATCLACLV